MRQSATPADKPAAQRRARALLAVALVLLVLCLTLAASAFAYSSASGGGLVQQASGATWELNAVSFSDVTHGWAVGDLGIVLATTDGGATWGVQRRAIG